MWPGSLNGPSGVGSLTQVGPSRTASRRLQAEADAAPAKEAIQRRDGGDETVSGNRAQLQCGLRYDLRLTVGSLTANGRDRDMPHCRIGLGAMPMAFASLDMHDITQVDLVLFRAPSPPCRSPTLPPGSGRSYACAILWCSLG